jgi:hypothetical protein
MKKFLLVIAAFTCMPIYSGDNKNSNNSSGIGIWLIGGAIVVGGYYGGCYIYNKYWNVPTPAIPQPTNTATAENDNEAPKNNDPVVTPNNNPVATPPVKNPFITVSPLIKKINKPNNEIIPIPTDIEKKSKQDNEQSQKQTPLNNEPIKVEKKVIEKIETEKKEETPWYHNKKLIKMMYDI